MNEQAPFFNFPEDGTISSGEVVYSDEERQALTALYETTLKTINQYEVVEGTVVRIDNREVLISIGFKSDGLIPITEFRDLSDLKEGDKVDVYIEEMEDGAGQLVLSRKKARLVKNWQKIQHAFEQKEILEGMVSRRTKGGLIVEISEIETFLPSLSSTSSSL